MVFAAGPSSETVVNIADDLPDGGKALRCFLSPVDALIDAYFERSGQHREVKAVAAMRRDAFNGIDSKQVTTCVHLAWEGKDGHTALRSNGRPIAHAQLIRQRVSHGIIEFEPMAETLEVFDQMYQRAGLFAWRETLADIRRWDQARMDETVRHALRTMPAGKHETTGDRQLMLFDPEFRQWHFVPFSAT
jgi:hypothetical protein